MKHKFLLKQITLFASIFAVSGGVTYYLCYQSSTTQNIEPSIPVDPDVPLKPAEVLFSSLMSLQQFNIDASLEFTYQEDMSHGNIDINGVADITDLNNLKITGDLNARYGASMIKGSVGYFDNTIYLDYNNSHLKLVDAELFDFIDMLPSMGVNVGVPNEIKNLDLNAMMEQLSNMEPVSCPDGYMFELVLNDAISVFFKSDFDYQFKGIRTNKFFYEDLFVFLDCDIASKNVDVNELVNPEEKPDAPVYQSFRPALNLINGLYNVFSNKQNTLGVNINLNKKTDAGFVNAINLNGDLSYDLNNNDVSFDFSIKENERTHNLGLYLKNETLFINQADINKISIQNQTISSLIGYFVNQINDETFKNFLDKMSTGMSGVDIANIISNLENLNNWIVGIDVLDDKVAVYFDLSCFDIDVGKFCIYANLNEDTLLGIHIDDLIFANYSIDVDIDVKDYNLFSPNAEEYVAMDPAMNLVPTIANLINQKQFRFEFNGLVDSLQAGVNDITINGGFQFDIEDKFGYGNVSIVDRDTYVHNIKADFRSDRNLLVSYNDKLNGKMSGSSIDDLSVMIQEIIQRKDEHFMELFGDILQKLNETPLFKALNGDIGLLFATETFTNISVSETKIEMDLSGALVGLDTTMHLAINYDENNLYGLEITNIQMNQDIISFKVDLKAFDNSLESTRLDPMATYFDFSDLKLLLALGINTAIYNDYHFTGKVNINLLGILNIDVPLDIKIKNNNGNVSLALEMSDIPTVIFVNKNPDYNITNSRRASIYYQDGLVYVSRIDRVKDGIFPIKTYDVEYSSVCTLDYFMDNIMYYLCEVVVGLNKNIMDQINGSITGSNPNNEPIRYEEILKDFYYNKTNSYFFVDINLAEIAKNPDLSEFTVKVSVDPINSTLSSLDVYLGVNVGVSIKLNANLNLVDLGSVVDLTKMDSYIQLHINDEQNVVKKVETRI